nr:hypothetical protein [Clostridium sporogenes]
MRKLMTTNTFEALLSHQAGKVAVTYVIYSGSIKDPGCILETGINTRLILYLWMIKMEIRVTNNK